MGRSEKSITESREEETKSPTAQAAISEVTTNGSTPGPTWSPKEEAKIVRKIDLFLIPTVWVMSLLAWMDRANLGNASIAGLMSDLSLSSTQFSLSISTFYFGYIAAVPLAMTILSRTRPSITLPTIIALWGLVTACMGAMNTFPQLIGLRTLLGALESIFNPGVTYLFSNWYRPDELGKRASYYMSAAQLGGAFGGLIAGGVMEHLEGDRGIRGWRWLFIIEGCVTVFAAVVVACVLPDYPGTWRRLSERERVIAVGRMRKVGIVTAREGGDGGGGVEKREKITVGRSVVIALKDWRTYGISIASMFLCATLLMVYFYPALVRGLGYNDPVKAQYMTVPIWVVGFVFSVASGFIGDRAARHRALFVSGWVSLGMVMAIATCLVYDFTARYVLLAFMTGGLWASFSQAMAFCAEVFQDAPPEVRAITLGIMSAASNTGNIYGAYLWPKESAPKYLLGFGMVAGAGGCTAIVFAAMWYKGRRDNLKKRLQQGRE